METKKIQLFETQLKTGIKEKKEFTIQLRGHYISEVETKTPGDILHENGTIQWVFKNVPDCLFYKRNLPKYGKATALSYN